MRLGRRIILALAATMVALPAGAYYDSRGHNLDSLERVVARWTPDAVDRASEGELVRLNTDYRNLMLGYSPINRDKSIFYARKALEISQPRGWKAADSDALRYLGQHFYSRDQFDSAMVYYKASLAAVDAMAAGIPSPTNPEGYDEKFVDDYYSALYGAIGNLYNMMDSIPQAMVYYEKAGAIFDKYGWNESNSILWYNIGETWVEQGDMKQARSAYDKAMAYAQASGDSLMIVDAWKGYGHLYLASGKTRKALPYLRRADAYYDAHPDYSPVFRTENLNYIKEALSLQKRQLTWAIGGFVLLVTVVCAVAFRPRRRSSHGGVKTPPHETSMPAEAAASPAVPSPGAPELNDRERDILALLAKAYTSKQIGEALFLSTETINWYRKKLLVKFDVANTPELVLKAKELGLI